MRPRTKTLTPDGKIKRQKASAAQLREAEAGWSEHAKRLEANGRSDVSGIVAKWSRQDGKKAVKAERIEARQARRAARRGR